MLRTRSACAWLLCLLTLLPPGDASPLHTSRRSLQQVGSDDPCVVSPEAAACADYVYPDATARARLLNLCGQMPWMIGCALQTECQDSNRTDGLCAAFSLYATVCQDPGMHIMIGCVDYTSMCQPDDGRTSLVPACKQQTGVARAVGTFSTQDAIVEMCSDHAMPGCEECPRTGERCPNPLGTISKLCHEMPSMAQCSAFFTMCDLPETAAVFPATCDSGGANFLPPMRMYFHTGLVDIILFKEWIPRSGAQYAWSVIAIIAAGVVTQALRAARSRLEVRWTLSLQGQTPPSRCGWWKGVAMRNSVRGVFTAVVMTLDYSLMLISMTFNVGIFFAVIAGLALGAALLGHVNEPSPGRSPVFQHSWTPAPRETSSDGGTSTGKTAQAAAIYHEAAPPLGNSTCCES